MFRTLCYFDFDFDGRKSELLNLKAKPPSCRFGILLDRSDSGLLLAVTIEEHMESLLFMMSLILKVSTMSNSGYMKLIDMLITLSPSFLLGINVISPTTSLFIPTLPRHLRMSLVSLSLRQVLKTPSMSSRLS